MPVHTFSCIDSHACANPVRLVAGGRRRRDGADRLERRAHFRSGSDWTHIGPMFEPRGHDMITN